MTIGENHESSFFIAMKGEHMQENKNEQTTGTKTTKKIGKTSYEVIVHFNDKSSETMQDKLKRMTVAFPATRFRAIPGLSDSDGSF